MLPRQIQNFIEIFSRLPSLGPRQARRLAFHLLSLDQQTLHKVSKTIGRLEELDRCPQCFFVKEKEEKLCRICRDTKRNPFVIMLVTKETDLISMENSGAFSGHYVIIGEQKIWELTNIQKLRIRHLIKRIKKCFGGKAEEIVIALPPTSEGDALAEKIKLILGEYANKITRLGRGMPTGGEIEFADSETLKNALTGRK